MGMGQPQSGTSYGRPSQYIMGSSPYGKSVDMVDVCTKLMEGKLLVYTCIEQALLNTCQAWQI